jgi:hypothetical protein
MKNKGKYLILKVSEAGEDTAVDAKKFDAMLKALVGSGPIPQKAVRKRTARRNKGGRG